MAEIRDLKGMEELLEKLEDLRIDRSLEISIMDRDIIVRKKLNDLLVAAGYHQVKSFKSGMDLLANLRQSDDERIAIYDLSDAKTSGVDFLHAIRKSDRDAWVWIIFLVKQKLPEEVYKSITSTGICEVIIKPVVEENLAKALRKVSTWIMTRRNKDSD